MAFFEQFGSKINQSINQMTSKTRDYTDQVKLGSEIKNMEKTVNGCYAELGRIYYEKKRGIYTDNLQKEEDIFTQIDTIRQMLEDKTKDKEELKNKVNCPACGKTVSESTNFCPYCGTAIIKKAPEEPVSQIPEVFCPNCGEPLEEDALFCTACGIKIEQPTESEDAAEMHSVYQENLSEYCSEGNTASKDDLSGGVLKEDTVSREDFSRNVSEEDIVSNENISEE